MKIALDTNIVCNACEHEMDAVSVAMIIRNYNFKILHDVDNCLKGEYINNAGGDSFFKKWYQEIERNNKILYLFGKLSKRIENELLELNFYGNVDKIIVGLALDSKENYIITEDSDFGKGPKKDKNLDALEYLTNTLNLTVHDANEAKQFLEELL